jgi:hypothetical protein
MSEENKSESAKVRAEKKVLAGTDKFTLQQYLLCNHAKLNGLTWEEATEHCATAMDFEITVSNLKKAASDCGVSWDVRRKARSLTTDKRSMHSKQRSLARAILKITDELNIDLGDTLAATVRGISEIADEVDK